MSTDFTRDECEALAWLVHNLASDMGEDFMGALMRLGAYWMLPEANVVPLADKLERFLEEADGKRFTHPDTGVTYQFEASSYRWTRADVREE